MFVLLKKTINNEKLYKRLLNAIVFELFKISSNVFKVPLFGLQSILIKLQISG
jgi:hypothetical protein